MGLLGRNSRGVEEEEAVFAGSVEELVEKVGVRVSAAVDRVEALRIYMIQAMEAVDDIESVLNWLIDHMRDAGGSLGGVAEWEDAALLAVSLLDGLARIPEAFDIARSAIEEIEMRWSEVAERAVKAYREGRLKEARSILAGFKGRERSTKVEPGTLVEAGVVTGKLMAEAGSASQEAELLSEKLERVAEALRKAGRMVDADRAEEASRAARALADALRRLGIAAADAQCQIDGAYVALIEAIRMVKEGKLFP